MEIHGKIQKNKSVEPSKKKESEVIILPKQEPKTEREVAQEINEIKKEEQKRTEEIIGEKKVDENEKSKPKKRTNLISISDLDEPEEIEPEKTTEKRNTNFKNEKLQEVWREYVNSQKEKGKYRAVVNHYISQQCYDQLVRNR